MNEDNEFEKGVSTNQFGTKVVRFYPGEANPVSFIPTILKHEIDVDIRLLGEPKALPARTA